MYRMWMTIGCVALMGLQAGAQSAADAAAAAAAGQAVNTEVGQELFKVEQSVRDAETAPVKATPEVSLEDAERAAKKKTAMKKARPVTAAEANEPVYMHAEPEAAEPAAPEPVAEKPAKEPAPAAATEPEPEPVPAAAEAPAEAASPAEEASAPAGVAAAAESPVMAEEPAAAEPAEPAVEAPAEEPAAVEAPAPEAAPVEETQPAATETEAAAAEVDSGPGLEVKALVIRGDADVLARAGLRKPMESEAVGKTLNEEQVAALAKKYQEALVNAGYYVARIWAPVQHWDDGKLTYVVDAGRVGKISLYKRQGAKTVPYKGRWYSQRQIQNRLVNIKPGTPFDYSELYGAVYSLNAHPDLTADVDLTVRKEGEGDEMRRHVDMDFEVKEERPLHAMIEFANSGTDVTEEWRAGLTVQYLNVSQNDDVITLSSPASLDLSTIRSTALSYYRPHHWRKGGNLSVFGGYSELATEDVVPGIDVEGTGWFAGLQGSYNFIDDEKRLLNLSLGLSHSTIEDSLVLPDGQSTEAADTAVSPLALTLSWATKKPNRRGARMSAVWMTEINQGGFLGASDDAEMQAQRLNASADYIIERLELSRVRPVFRNKSDPKKDWLMYGRLVLQYATEPLIPSEQMGVGGQNTVRGYLENEVLADNGAVGTFELRTPIRHSSRIPRWMKKDVKDRKYLDFEGTQFVFFGDAAYVTLNDALSGQEENYTLISVGPGLRFSAGEHFTARADWGFPLEETEDSSMAGRGHFSVQFLF